MQERLISAAATTSMFLRKGISETKDKMAVGKIKVEEVVQKKFLILELLSMIVLMNANYGLVIYLAELHKPHTTFIILNAIAQ